MVSDPQLNGERPDLSVVVAIVSDTVRREYDLDHLAGCLEALRQQNNPPRLEIIVPYPDFAKGEISRIAARFPEAKYVCVDDLQTYQARAGGREHHDELRARGLEAARGDILALIEDHGWPGKGWSRGIFEAHKGEYAAVGGAMENGVDRSLNWAVYFLDFAKYQNPVPSGEAAFVSDANVSYKRSDLESVRSVWESAFREPEVNWAITSSGGKLALAQDAVVYQYRNNLTLSTALRERYVWGRSYAGSRGKQFNAVKRAFYTLVSCILPGLLLLRTLLTVFRKGRNRRSLIMASPLIAILATSWSIGEMVGYVTGRASSKTEAGAVRRSAPVGT